MFYFFENPGISMLARPIMMPSGPYIVLCILLLFGSIIDITVAEDRDMNRRIIFHLGDIGPISILYIWALRVRAWIDIALIPIILQSFHDFYYFSNYYDPTQPPFFTVTARRIVYDCFGQWIILGISFNIPAPASSTTLWWASIVDIRGTGRVFDDEGFLKSTSPPPKSGCLPQSFFRINIQFFEYFLASRINPFYGDKFCIQ